MPFQLELPDIGEGVVEAEVQQWFVAPGDHVEEDQPLVEVMTDKATVVIPSPRRGRVVRLFAKVGEVAKVHAPLVELDTGGRGEEAAAHEVSRSAARSEGSLAPASAGETRFGAAAKPPSVKGKALATPAVRAMAREMGIAIDAVAGTGPGGRVTKDDLAHARRRNGHAPSSAHPEPLDSGPAAQALRSGRAESKEASTAPTSTPTSTSTTDERVPLRGLRKRIAENMARSKRTAAHFTFVEQCDASELVRVKERFAAAARDEGARITFLPFILKAAVAALRKHPRMNATMDEERGELVVHRRYDLGVASATDAGLVVPVVRGVDRLSFLDLARELERLAASAKESRLRPEDVGRSTFTVTSLGALGGLFATPVLNHPEVAILGIHRIRPTPVARGGEVVVRDVMHVSVTCDHRVVDGHEAAAFAYEVIRHLESPDLLFMHMA
jgi:pyruvate dehydrogenase E2 component (dihydrolipoyllysine-residue acetyltransferase)